jgi:YVTN family beta-propeller protein
MSAVNPPQRIGVIDRRAMTVEEIDVFIPRPHALAANPRAGLAYSASLAENRMAVVDPAAEEVELRPLPVPAGHAGHAMHGAMEGMVHTVVDFDVSPDGRTLVASGEVSRELLVFDITDPRAPRLVKQVPVEARPWEPRFTSDGRWVWLSNLGANAVTLLDARGWSVAAVIRGEGLSEPYGVAVSPDDRWVYVTNSNLKGAYPGENGTLVVIDAAARAIAAVIPVGRNPTGVGTNVRR